MEEADFRHLYDSVLDFKKTAELIEAEIARRGINVSDFDIVPHENNRSPHEMWISMKAVSHFNLGISLELMLKLLLKKSQISWEDKDIISRKDRHKLAILYDILDCQDKCNLDKIFRNEQRYSGLPTLYYFTTIGSDGQSSPCPPYKTNNIRRLRGFLEFLDKDVGISHKRYSWEYTKVGRWRYYLDDISVFVQLIDGVMQQIPRTEVVPRN